MSPAHRLNRCRDTFNEFPNKNNILYYILMMVFKSRQKKNKFSFGKLLYWVCFHFVGDFFFDDFSKCSINFQSQISVNRESIAKFMTRDDIYDINMCGFIFYVKPTKTRKNLHDGCKSHGFLNPISLRCMTHLRHFTVNFLLTLRIIPKFINSHMQNSIDKWISCLFLLLVYLMIVLFHFVGLDGSFLFPAKSF